jgi:flagellar biosynthesis protein FlhF
MNVKRFTARTSREALALVKQAFGNDAVVMSTRPCPEGVEVLAMAPESLQHIERIGSTPAAAPRRPAAERAPQPEPMRAPAPRHREAAPRIEPPMDAAPPTSVDDDVETLAMSTLSFQDFVRERMLKRRQVELADAPAEPRPVPTAGHGNARARLGGTAIDAQRASMREPPVLRETVAADTLPAAVGAPWAKAPAPSPAAPPLAAPTPLHPAPAGFDIGSPRSEQADMLGELRSMRGLIEQRFGALAFMEKLQRQPRQAQLTQKLLDCGLSPQLTRKLVESLPSDADETAWAASVLERNLVTAEREPALEDAGGVYALIGSTGVGKTTGTAKLAAAFATRHGAAQLGLITLDAYRVGAHEQLRTYGRILGVPVHTAHDRASLEDLLELLSAKKMVLIDTAGMAQRDSRTRELLEMLSHRSIKRLLVVNAGAQGETIEDGLIAWCAAVCHGVILSKLDEAVKLAPALDALIRHKLKVLAVANGQRVPEDWHRLSASALVQRALRGGGGPAWRLDGGDVNLVFAGLPVSASASASATATAQA